MDNRHVIVRLLTDLPQGSIFALPFGTERNGSTAMDRWLVNALSLMEAIQSTAAQISSLRNEQMRGAGLDWQRWAVLRAISRSSYCLSISDLARVLKQSRQATHRAVLELNRSGWLELLPNHDDRRILQLALSANGKNAIVQIRR